MKILKFEHLNNTSSNQSEVSSTKKKNNSSTKTSKLTNKTDDACNNNMNNNNINFKMTNENDLLHHHQQQQQHYQLKKSNSNLNASLSTSSSSSSSSSSTASSIPTTPTTPNPIKMPKQNQHQALASSFNNRFDSVYSKNHMDMFMSNANESQLTSAKSYQNINTINNNNNHMFYNQHRNSMQSDILIVDEFDRVILPIKNGCQSNDKQNTINSNVSVSYSEKLSPRVLGPSSMTTNTSSSNSTNKMKQRFGSNYKNLSLFLKQTISQTTNDNSKSKQHIDVDNDSSSRSTISLPFSNNINSKLLRDKQRNSSNSSTGSNQTQISENSVQNQHGYVDKNEQKSEPIMPIRAKIKPSDNTKHTSLHYSHSIQVNDRSKMNDNDNSLSITNNSSCNTSKQQSKLNTSYSFIQNIRNNHYSNANKPFLNENDEEQTQLSGDDDDDFTCFESLNDDAITNVNNNHNNNKTRDSVEIPIVSNNEDVNDTLNQIQIGLLPTDTELPPSPHATLPPLPPFQSINTVINNNEQIEKADLRRTKRTSPKPIMPSNIAPISSFSSSVPNNVSCLTKAISTPSIVDKVNNDAITPNDEDPKVFKYSKRSEKSSSSQKLNNGNDAHYTDKELVTMDEFLKEYESNEKKSLNKNEQKSSTPIVSSLSASCLTIPASITTPTLGIDKNANESSTSSLSSPSPPPSIITSTTTPKTVQFDSQSTKTIPKTRKFGQIFKLASVRGAKSKSMKHKLTAQLQQHSFINIKCENNCHVCKKSLLNKKAAHCKNCLLNVHDHICKEESATCSNFKCTKKTLPTSITDITNSLLSESVENSSIFLNTKRDQYANTVNRPKSMDISKYFTTYLSRSTSNMYRSYSNPSLIEDIEEERTPSITSSYSNTIENDHTSNDNKKEKKFFNNHSNNNNNNKAECISYKSISEETADFNSINRLRESIDSLNFKYDEKNDNVFNENVHEISLEFSKYEAEFSDENWTQSQNKDEMQKLNKTTRYKQENIFELIKTELNYVKVLTITKHIYVNGIMSDSKVEQKQLDQMFPKLDQLIEIHTKFLNKLLERYKSNQRLVDSIGDVLYEFFNLQSENLINIYTKFCCLHLIAKSTYNTLLMNNKSFASLLEESRKHILLRRYQIPDCLTIITQRLAKHLTLIENMLKNTKDDETEYQLLLKSIERLRCILSRINDAVAFYQNSNDFKKIFENIDAKSFTYIVFRNDRILEHRKFFKNDINLDKERKYLCIKQVTVKCMSKNNKVFKDITCLTTSDMIMFVQLNDKNKYVFMNDNSVIPCINGILIRPKANENASTRISSSCLNGNNNNSLPCYIVNTITNEIIEIKFVDDLQRNEWLSLVHTHITPYIEDNVNKDDTSSTFESFIANNSSSSLSNTNTNNTSSTEQSVNYNNSSKNYRNQTVVYASDCAHNLTNAINKLQINDSVNTSTTQSNCTGGENLNISSLDAQITPEISSLFESFNSLIEQALFQNAQSNYDKLGLNNLMRSASSAGETITRSNHDPHISVPKRAETFNGASSKDLTLLLNTNELKTRSHKNSVANSSSCIASGCSTNSDAISHTNTDLSGDSGFQSRFGDINHDYIDGENYSCTCDINNKSLSQTKPKDQFVNLLKCMINDYLRVKDENEILKLDLELRSKKIDTLQETLEQVNLEKMESDRRLSEFEKRENDFIREKNEFAKQQALLKQHLQLVMNGFDPLSSNSRPLSYNSQSLGFSNVRYDRNSIQTNNQNNYCNLKDDNSLSIADPNVLFL